MSLVSPEAVPAAKPTSLTLSEPADSADPPSLGGSLDPAVEDIRAAAGGARRDGGGAEHRQMSVQGNQPKNRALRFRSV